MDSYFVELTTPVTYPAELYGGVQLPPLTHYQVCKLEVEFQYTQVDPHAIIYLGLVYFASNVKHKPPIPGKTVTLTGTTYQTFWDSKKVCEEKELCDFLVAQGYVAGTRKKETFTSWSE